jgi:hypothetical protein
MAGGGAPAQRGLRDARPRAQTPEFAPRNGVWTAPDPRSLEAQTLCSTDPAECQTRDARACSSQWRASGNSSFPPRLAHSRTATPRAPTDASNRCNAPAAATAINPAIRNFTVWSQFTVLLAAHAARLHAGCVRTLMRERVYSEKVSGPRLSRAGAFPQETLEIRRVLRYPRGVSGAHGETPGAASDLLP